MENYKIKYFDNFKMYLLDTAGIAPYTANDYIKRIIKICEEENVLVEDINSHIETWKEEYTTGSKKELGSRSHNSYRSAILKYYEYFVSLNNKTTNNKYQVIIQRQGSGFGSAILKSPSGKNLCSEIILQGKKHEIMRKVWEMLWDMFDDKGYNENGVSWTSLFQQLNVTVTIDGKKVI